MLTPDLIVAAMTAAKNGSQDSDTAIQDIAQAIVDTMKEATIVAPETTGLAAPDGPVTGSTSTWTLE